MVSKLFVQRLFVLTRNGHIAYDEQFHKGGVRGVIPKMQTY